MKNQMLQQIPIRGSFDLCMQNGWVICNRILNPKAVRRGKVLRKSFQRKETDVFGFNTCRQHPFCWEDFKEICIKRKPIRRGILGNFSVDHSFQPRLFFNFSYSCFFRGFSFVNTTAWQDPDRDISPLNQQDTISFRIKNNTADRSVHGHLS